MAEINLRNLPLNELKWQLVTSWNFESVMRYFFDHFAERPGFLEASHPVEVPDDLAQGMRPLISTLFAGKNTLATWRIAEVALLGIVHGTVDLGKKSAIVLSARDLRLGIVAVPGSKPGEMLYARLGVTPPAKATQLYPVRVRVPLGGSIRK